MLESKVVQLGGACCCCCLLPCLLLLQPSFPLQRSSPKLVTGHTAPTPLHSAPSLRNGNARQGLSSCHRQLQRANQQFTGHQLGCKVSLRTRLGCRSRTVRRYRYHHQLTAWQQQQQQDRGKQTEGRGVWGGGRCTGRWNSQTNSATSTSQGGIRENLPQI